jgi:hypothetical protein
MKLRNSNIAVLTFPTFHNSSSLRVRAYAYIEKECFKTSNASFDAFDFPSANGYLTIGGVQ